MEREHNEINIRVATDAQQILQIYAPYIEKRQLHLNMKSLH